MKTNGLKTRVAKFKSVDPLRCTTLHSHSVREDCGCLVLIALTPIGGSNRLSVSQKSEKYIVTEGFSQLGSSLPKESYPLADVRLRCKSWVSKFYRETETTLDLSSSPGNACVVDKSLYVFRFPHTTPVSVVHKWYRFAVKSFFSASLNVAALRHLSVFLVGFALSVMLCCTASMALDCSGSL